MSCVVCFRGCIFGWKLTGTRINWVLGTYQNKLNKNDINWFTNGGCVNNGERNAIAAFAIYGQNDGYE